MAYAHDASPPARRRVALRTVPATPHLVVPEPVARLAMPAEEQNFLETLRKLWRHRLLIAGCTFVIGSAAVLAAWLMPSYYVSEARVLVGVQNPRLPNVESIVADVSPDAERVQNEGFILQSRLIAKQVIDQLKLRENPEFNPELARSYVCYARLLRQWGQQDTAAHYLSEAIAMFQEMGIDWDLAQTEQMRRMP